MAAIAESAGRFLVVEERISGRLVLNQPAGHVEQGESLLEAVVREVREETAWGFVPRHLIGAYLWSNPLNGQTTLRFAFDGEVGDHDARQSLDEGIVATHWLTQEDLRARENQLRSPLVLRCVEDYLNGRRTSVHSVAHLDLATAHSFTAAETVL